MASRTKQKEEARARRLAEENARLERQRRQRRLRMLSGVVLGAVAVIAVAIAISSGGSGSSGLKTGNQATQTVAQVNRLLSGIPQSGARLGNPRAPVTMIYYGDLECPVCRDFTLNGGFPQLVAKDVRDGKVQVVYRSFETATQNPQTFQTQQVAALAAGRQNRFWHFADLFYHEQGSEGTDYVTDGYLSGLASQVPGLNMSSWQSARNDSSLINQVQSEMQAGSAAGVKGTPTLIVQGARGKSQVPESVPSYDQLQQAIKSVT
jgi:protein-disulfide isomerase